MGKDDKMKIVLVIGNGYDIAHGLNTRYGDFVSFFMKYSV